MGCSILRIINPDQSRGERRQEMLRASGTRTDSEATFLVRALSSTEGVMKSAVSACNGAGVCRARSDQDQAGPWPAARPLS